MTEERLDRLERKLDDLTNLMRLQLADWLTLDHAALVCDCSYDTLRRAVERGELPAADIGNGEQRAAHRVARSDLNDWLERHRGGKALLPRSELKDKMNRYLP